MKGFSKSFEKQSANFVLIYGDNGDRTSIITPELIAEAVARAQSSHTYVELQCCIPLKLHEGSAKYMRWGYDPNSDVPFAAIYFTENDGTHTRYIKTNCTKSRGEAMLCSLFEHSQIPPLVIGWEKQWLRRAQEEIEPYILYAGNDEFKHFDFDDVLAAIEQLCDGEIDRVMLQTESAQNGYLEACKKADGYQVEFQTDDEETGIRRGFRRIVCNLDDVQQWFADYYNERKAPDISPEWDEFDVEEFFNNLANKL